MEQLFYTLVAVIVVALVPFNLLTTLVLRGLFKRSDDNPVLKERYRVSAILFVASSIGAIVGFNRLTTELFHIGFSSPYSVMAMAIIVILVSIPGLMFLYSYFIDGFK